MTACRSIDGVVSRAYLNASMASGATLKHVGGFLFLAILIDMIPLAFGLFFGSDAWLLNINVLNSSLRCLTSFRVGVPRQMD